MGNTKTTLTQEQLDQYQDCTYFSRNDIARLHARFTELNPHRSPDGTVCNMPDIKINPDIIAKIPEIKDNPFVDRIISVFSNDPSGAMTFDDFLDMFNAFSENAPIEVKTFYAFKIYDTNGDQFISSSDLKDILKRLTRDALTAAETELIIEKVLEESEMDDDHQISFMEFDHVVSRSPDFLRYRNLALQ